MTTDRQAFIVSAVLHAAALGLVAAVVFIKPFKPKEDLVVLELVALPEDAPPAPQAPAPAIDQPVFDQPNERPLPEIAIPEPPPPRPPTPRPEPPPPQPAPEPPKPKLMTMDDFKRSHGLPDQVRRETPRSAPQPAPRINSNQITQNLDKLLEIDPSATPSSEASPLIAQYQARLVQAIELRWSKPAAGTGNEWAEVRFQVGKNGAISNLRIVRHDGPESFVASIKRAIENTPGVGPRPNGWNGDMVITFRLR